MSQLKQRNNMDKGLDRIMDVVEDHAKIGAFLIGLEFYITNPKAAKPNMIPYLNDTAMMDTLGRITEAVKKKEDLRVGL